MAPYSRSTSSFLPFQLAKHQIVNFRQFLNGISGLISPIREATDEEQLSGAFIQPQNFISVKERERFVKEAKHAFCYSNGDEVFLSGLPNEKSGNLEFFCNKLKECPS